MNTSISQNKRERLIESAAKLFHTQGVHVTSLADIAKDAQIPIGNVYYYFKTKEELAVAALEKRREQFMAAYTLLEQAIDDPRQRIIEAVRYFDKVRDEYSKHGCPVGKIIQDTDVANDNIAKQAAQILFDFADWSERQFQNLGNHENARKYAVTLMSGIQGAIVMAKAYKDPAIISAEVERLVSWLESIPNRKIQIGKVGLRQPSTATSNAA